MKLKRVLGLGLFLAFTAGMVFAGGAQDTGDGVKTITVITHRTDLVDNLFQEYATKFHEEYPNIEVQFEGITDYEGEIKIRMNTDEYGDVLMIPKENFAVSEYPDFFEPLGTSAEMAAKYEFSSDTEYDGMVYGVSSVGNAQGMLYNTEVFAQAGITEIPASPEAFIAALQLIKENTDAIPYYTNYAAGWPLGGQWEAEAPNVAGDADWSNFVVPHQDKPWGEGEPYYIMAKLLWDMVELGLIEDDPTTTDWESCKGMIARGEIATMLLGSWSIIQMQQAAEAQGIDASVIGYMPFPYTNADGKVYSSVGSDYHLGINVHSDYKEAAKTWIDWFTEKSGFAAHEQGIPALKDAPYPQVLTAFQEMGVVFIQNTPSPADEVGLLDAIDSESEIGRWSEAYRLRIVEAAIQNRDESFQDIMDMLNNKWTAARAALNVN